MRPLTVILLFLAIVTAACTLVSTPTPTPTPASLFTQGVAVVFFDVGESGDGFLVVTGEGKYMLIDGGGRNSGIVSALKVLEVPRIDYVVATNPDADHIGGLIDVLKSFPIGEVWLSGDINTTITFEDFVDAVDASKAQVHEARRGDAIRLGSVTAEVLNPSEPLFSDRNNNSVALRLEYGKVSFLFTGDMEAKAEARLLQSGGNLKSTILKLGHHGSRTSTSAPFLAAVQPEVAVYQAGVDNKYGHPHAETLQALAQAKVKVYGTGANGVIIISTDGTSYQVQTQR